MFARGISLSHLFCFCALTLCLVLAGPPAVAQVEFDPPDDVGEGGSAGDPGGEAIDIRGGTAMRIQPNGLMSIQPDLMNLWQCDDTDTEGVVDAVYLEDTATLQLGEQICNCGWDSADVCEASACDYPSVDDVFELCGIENCPEDGLSASVANVLTLSPIPVVQVRLNICYQSDIADAKLLVRVADSPSGVFGGALYHWENVLDIGPGPADNTGTCPAGLRLAQVIPDDPMIEGSYNVQLSIWESNCSTADEDSDALPALVGGESENWSLKVGMLAPNCTQAEVLTNPYNPDERIPGPESTWCDENWGAFPDM